MKKSIFLISLLSGIIMHQAMAQEFRSGIKGGVNLANLYDNDVNDKNIRWGFHAGVFTQVPVGDNLAIQPELLYTQKGNSSDYEFDFFDGEAETDLNYVELPLLLNIKLMDIAEVHIGPYAALLVDADVGTSGTVDDEFQDLDLDNFNRMDYGVAGGLGINIENLQIGGRYNLGLRRVADSGVASTLFDDFKNSVFYIYLALGF